MADKKSPYFSHDFTASEEPEMVHLLMEMDNEGIGIYWRLVEYLHKQGGYLYKRDLQRYAYVMHTQCTSITKVLQDFALFESDEEKYWSNRVLRNLEAIEAHSLKGKKAAQKRWNGAQAMPTHSTSNANKEIKEIKKESKETSHSPFSKNGKTTFNDDWFDKHIWDPWLNKDCSREEAKEYFIEACVTHETTRDKAWLAAKGVLNYFRSRNVAEGVIMNFKTFFLESDGAKITLWANAPPN